MPIDYDIVEEKRLIVVVGSGVITAEDIYSHLNSLVADSRYLAPMKKLVDYRTIESIRISPDEATSIALMKKGHAERFAGERCAFVSPGNLTYGTSRVHQALVESADINTAVFRTMEEAQEWLDYAPDKNHDDG